MLLDLCEKHKSALYGSFNKTKAISYSYYIMSAVTKTAANTVAGNS